MPKMAMHNDPMQRKNSYDKKSQLDSGRECMALDETNSGAKDTTRRERE